MEFIHHLGPSVLMFGPYVWLLPFFTSKLKVRTLEFVLDIKIVFMKLVFCSLADLNISIASVLILLIFIDSLPILSRRTL